MFSSSGYGVASDQLRLRSPTGDRVAGSRRVPPRRLPSGLMHAWELGADETVCGLELVELHPFPRLSFEQLDEALDRCSACVTRLAG